MPSATILHAACFAIGAAVGGAAASLALPRKRELTPIHASVSSPSPSPSGSISGSGPPTISLPTPGSIPFPRPGSGTTPLVEEPSAGISQQNALMSSTFAGQILKYGNPGPIADLLVRKAYIASYDRRLRHPAWTAEHLTLSALGKSLIEAPPDASQRGDRVKSAFIEDNDIPTAFRAKLTDYMRSGYDRGHMVPAADAKMSQEAMDETFLLTNISPQVGEGFNRHYWAYVEEWCRRLTVSYKDVFIFTVPLYLPKQSPDGKWRVTYEVIGSPPNVAVPTHFAKVVLTSRPSSPSTPHIPEIFTGAFVLPNEPIPDETPFEKFVVPVEAVERAAGLSLFSDAIKSSSKHICKSTKCEVIVRRFDEAQKRPTPKRSMTTP